jgi:D-sedoheptulose 7-phosphate isomerase
MLVTPQSGCRPYFELLSRTIEALPFSEVDNVASLLVNAFETGHTIFTFGNGGSAALASHFACDLGKGIINGSSKRFRVMALTDNVPLMTAWANDSNYEDIFSEQLANFAVDGDVAFAISASGNSPNVLKALRLAKQLGLVTSGVTGFAGGQMRTLCDECIIVPCDNMQIIEDLHLCIAHSLFSCVRARIAGEWETRPVLRPHLVHRSIAR